MSNVLSRNKHPREVKYKSISGMNNTWSMAAIDRSSQYIIMFRTRETCCLKVISLLASALGEYLKICSLKTTNPYWNNVPILASVDKHNNGTTVATKTLCL